MSEALDKQIDALKHSIATLEAQRNTLDEPVLKAALTPLQEKLAELQERHLAEQLVEQQRKQVTVLFMDIGGSTELVNGMDPEEAMEVFDSTLKQLGKVVESHGGRVTRYTGDGLLAVFGVPVSHEEDPQRAVHAALNLIDEAKKLVKTSAIPEFGIRVGINTGLVAIGGQTEAEDTLMGSAVNLAARLESAAPVGCTLISHETYRNVRGLFDIQVSEPIIARGFAEPVRAYQVLGAKARSLRTPLRGVEGLETPMVGRESELKYLQDALMNVLESNEGQVITVSGEAGMGKSRLLEEFQNWLELRPEHMLLLQGRGWIEGQGQPFALLREVLEDRFEILEDDGAGIVREKFLHGLQAGLTEEAEMKAHLLGQMLGYDFKDSPHTKGVLGEGEQLRNRGMMYLGEYFQGISRQNPAIMLLEDIHWADDSTLDAVNWLEERMGKLRMLIVCAGREALFERRPYWGEGEERHTRVSLKPLTKRASRELVEQILRQVTNLPETLRELVVENAEGNPFYLEELIKMLIEDGVIVKGEDEWRVEREQLQITTVPSTLTGVLQARLDGLPAEERSVLQEASVVGRQFWDRVVAYVHAGGNPGVSTGLLQERLSSLRGRELIFRHETSAFAEAHEYLFKHDLLREVTYESVLKKVRRAHHSLVADWLIANAGGRVSEYTGLIGEHLVLGGRGEEAITYLLRAGDAALDAYSNREAERFYRRALDLKPNDEQQLHLFQGLGKALDNLGRPDEASQVLNKAIELSRRLNDLDGLAQSAFQLSQVLYRFMYMDTSKSWGFCQQTAKELDAAPPSPGLARLFAETGRQAFFAHEPKEMVVEYCQRAIEMAEQLGIIDVQLDSNITLGIANPDAEESIRILKQAGERAEANGLLYLAGRAYLNAAFTENGRFNASAAIVYHRKALEFGQRVGAKGIGALRELAWDYIETGRLQEVPALVEEFMKQTSIPEQYAREYQLDITSMLHAAKGDYVQDLKLLRFEIAEARQRKELAVIVTLNISLAFDLLDTDYLISQGDLSEAETALNENLEIIKENPSIGDGFYTQLLLARIEARQGKTEQAQQRLAEGEKLLDQKDGFKKLTHDFTKYKLARSTGQWNEAVEITQSLVDRVRDGGNRWFQARNRIDLGDSLRGRDSPEDREQALQIYQEAQEIFKEMGADGYVQILQKRIESLDTGPSQDQQK